MVENKEKTFCPFYEPNPFSDVGRCVRLGATHDPKQDICTNTLPGRKYLWEAHYCPHEKSIKDYVKAKRKNKEKWIKYHEEKRK